MFKNFKPLLLSIGLLLIFSFSYGSVEKSNINSIISYAKNVEKGNYDNYDVYKIVNIISDGSEVETTLFWSKENTADHDYFDWKWTIHVLKIHYYKAYNTIKLEIASRDYQDFVSIRSRGFIQWALVDVTLDGKINSALRDFSIVACDDEEEGCIHNHIIFPNYPKGFINTNWYNPSEEESNERYNKEINYWIKTIWGEK